ncbi:hypothetical protein [Thermosynechococcus sp.]
MSRIFEALGQGLFFMNLFIDQEIGKLAQAKAATGTVQLSPSA